MKKLVFAFALIFGIGTMMTAQETMSLDELKAMKADKEAVAAGIGEEIAGLDKRIKEFPGWTYGMGVLFGLDFAGSEKWYAVDLYDQSSSAFSINLNAFANKNEDKYFWRNGLLMGWSRTKVVDNTTVGAVDAEPIDVGTLDLSSIGGYYFYQDKIAASARANWSTVLFDFSPGSITVSAGLSYTPTKDLLFWVHPLGYQLNYPGELESTPGANYGGSYTGTIAKNIKWTSNLDGFYSYTSADDGEPSNNNWTWTNGFVIDNIFKGIGVGASVGLRSNEQLAKLAGAAADGWGDLQLQYAVGLSYNISK